MDKRHYNSTSELMEMFLEFENHSNVLEYHYRYSDMLIWPFVRYAVWGAIIKSNLGENGENCDITKQNMGKSKILSYKWSQLFKLKKNPIFCKKTKDIIFLCSATGYIKDATGQYYDRVHDEFVAMYDNTAIIEDAPLFRHFYPRKYKAYESDALDIICLFNEKLARLNKADKETINMLIEYLKVNLPVEIKATYWRTIRIELERYAKNNKLIYHFYKKCFINMHPKLVFVSKGCYGNHVACKVKVLKDLGIPCVEIQHGMTHSSHMAYNYSRSIYESKEYQEYMPDLFLTMGKYWMSRVKIPIKMQALGSANFYRNMQKENDEQPSHDILVLPVEMQPWLELVTFLKERLPDKKIIVKMHPSFRKEYEIFKEIEAPNVKVCIDGNIYDYLNQVDIVIGDSSTVLYEAAALKKTVLVWNNDRSSSYTDARLGCWFNDRYELVKLLENPELIDSKNSIAPEDIYEYDMRSNYLTFIGKYLSDESII